MNLTKRMLAARIDYYKYIALTSSTPRTVLYIINR